MMTTARRNPVFLALLFILPLVVPGGPGSTLVAQERPDPELRPRVAVLGIGNSTGLATHDALAGSVRRTILLTLTLLDRYEVIDRDEPRGPDLAAQAAALPAETLLWGDVSLDDAGAIAISVTIFDAVRERVVLSETETAASLLDVFDSADSLVANVIGAFSGTRVGFASITIEVAGTGDYRVRLDQATIGTNVTTLERVLAGSYRVRVDQDLPEGYRTVYDREVQLEDGERVTVAVQLLDEDSIRAEILSEAVEWLESLLAAAPGPGTVVSETDRALARFTTYATDETETRWYRYRVELQREYRSILDYRYFADSIVQFDRTLPRTLLAASHELHESVPNDAFTAEQWRVLDGMSRRNRNAFYGVMMLAADYQTVLGNVEEQALPYEILFDLDATGLSVVDDGPYRPEAEHRDSTGMVRDYTTAIERQRPLWQTLMIGVGAVGVSVAGVIFGTGMPGDRLDDGKRTYDLYRATDDPDEAVRLREQTENYYDEARLLLIGGAAAGAVGVTAITTGVAARIRSRRRPQRILDDYLTRLGEPRLNAAISFFEGGDGDRLVLVRSDADVDAGRTGPSGDDRRLRIGDRPETPEHGPAVYTDLPVGIPVTWTSRTIDAGEFVHHHVVHPGRNVMFVP